MDYNTLLVSEENSIVTVVLNRPTVANAMSLEMVNELTQAMNSAVQTNARALIIKGSSNTFCSGGDIKDMRSAMTSLEAVKDFNRSFGRMISLADQLPLVLITALEGAVLGGGFGLACVSDVAIATQDCQFGLPETGLGITPAQIAPFVVQRIGLTQTRRLALLGMRFKSPEALRLGVVHQVVDSADALDEAITGTIKQLTRCAPMANIKTKALLHRVGTVDMETLLDQAADDFAQAVTGSEGSEGAKAFMQKRKPQWATSTN